MNAAAPTRSTFVTVVAWIFLMLSGFGLFISLLQNLMIHLLFPPEAFEEFARMPAPPGMPAGTGWIFGNLKAFFALMVLPVLAIFAASLGLLKRWEWGRKLFIAMMALSIGMNLVMLVFQGFMMVGLHGQFEALAQAAPAGQAPPDIGAFLIGISVFALIYSLGISAVQAWIIKRLMSAPVVAEFRAASAQA